MASSQLALERLCDPEFEVSAHYLICSTGTLYQLVSDEMRAWHAGVGSWGGLDDINSHSIGIELDNNGQVPFTEVQMNCLKALLRDLMTRFDIPPSRVIGHSDMAPGRKSDPGAMFDWQDLAAAGLSVWATTDQQDGPAFDRAAAAFGYPITPYTLEAFRLRFRPKSHGPEEPSDRALMQALAAAYPVDPIPDAG
ncbi:N-acetylmuramoyl-L-alanine amidase [Algirhabdus cladophorae]|uniref:N-acetylmuramoyl-L-alanine amidase n=1 Tax=Algirhabdus cladophorae TaxID=3377108 RepID=UPI003B848001